ncbi:hypothetical protein AS96_10275 [Microbacterium sp. MRS-1]|nr:hypothetical protein AS96_10275 [Microbacterium sp. MRS-1]
MHAIVDLDSSQHRERIFSARRPFLTLFDGAEISGGNDEHYVEVDRYLIESFGGETVWRAAWRATQVVRKIENAGTSFRLRPIDARAHFVEKIV